MIPKQTIKKLCLVALYTSPVIAALVVTPLFIMSGYRPLEYIISLLLMTALVLLMWGANILLVFLLQKQQGNLLRYLLSYLPSVLFNAITVEWLFGESMHGGGMHHGKAFHFHLIVFFSINTVVLVLLDLTLVKEKNVAIKGENMQLRVKNMEAANQQLKQQVQPHFLFNSLSTLKALIKNSPANAEEYLVRLSDFLRYSISAGQLNTVPVADEVKLCVDYLEMQKIRFGEALQFNINVPEDIQQQKQVPVFALQMLAENAIKHNMFTVRAPMFINIVYSDGLIAVHNNLQPNDEAQTTGGLGLSNLAERYKILSGEDIIISKNENTFSVSIKVI